MHASAGCRVVEVFDAERGTPFPMLVMYPSSGAERPARLGPYEASVAMDGAVAAGTFPLVVVSHGSGGSHLAYRTLAAHLARRGFVVALPAHPGNNRDDDRLAGTDALLERRPRDVRLAIDRAYAADTLGARLVPDAVAIVGHSLGGYTALVVAGGLATAFPPETPDGRARALPPAGDDRVRGIVLLAPATPWLMAPGALRGVRVPVLLLSGERDEHTPGWHADVVLRGVPDPALVEHHVVANAGHFAFLSPFPPAMTRPDFPPSQDPPGFDRAAFHEELNARVEAFLRRVLPVVPVAARRGTSGSPGDRRRA